MKTIIRLLILVLFLSASAFSQIKGLGWAAKFGAAIGYTPLVIKPDLNPLNDRLNISGFPELNDKPIFASGFSGYFYIMSLKNFRIGGTGFSGVSEESFSLSGVTSSSKYEISGGGITLEYTLPFVKGIGISLGTTLGIGNLEINLHKNDELIDWNNFDQLESSHYKIYSNYYILIPTINLDIPVNRFLAFRAGAGYQTTFSYDWKISNDTDLNNVPEELNGDAFFVQAGVLIGFFAF